MGKNLIIVESPTKVKSIEKFKLGKNYKVTACAGHVRDLPSNTLGVDENNGFEPQYEIIHDKEKIVSELQSQAKDADTVYLAPDPDREGEAIACHIAVLLKDKAKDIKRIQFNEITKKAILEALEHPRDLDVNLFHAQQARRVLDRLVGYKISPLLWKTVKRGISAGRVQSVALRLIVERELEREAFRPEEYWLFHALLKTPQGEPIRLELAKVDDSLGEQPFMVTKVESRRRERQPQPPFITSTLQQVANTRHGYSAKRTMGIAQRLYEGIEMKDGSVTALITYMRTDSTRISDEAKAAAADFIAAEYGRDYLPAEKRSFKVKETAQDAHEAIRPVDVTIVPEAVRPSLTDEQYNVYRLVWARFVASQMAVAVYSDTSVTAACGGTEWQAKGQRQLFDGWTRVLPGDKDSLLPDLSEGMELARGVIEKEQKFTQPPARYSEASLVRSLEELGIGRPSTYATIITTLENREYVEKKERAFVPTELGRVVCRQLLDCFPNLMDVHFTADMENKLDMVAEGTEGWVELLTDFSRDFNPSLDKAAKEMKNFKGGMETNLVCPDCGKPLLIRFGKAGAFLACQGYPDCKYSSNFVRDAEGVLSPAASEVTVVGTCPDCGSDLIVKRARTGSRFIACSSYPECRHTSPYTTGVVCPKCSKGHLVEKSSKKGKLFYSCDRYPDCDFATWNEPVARVCPDCGSPYLVIRRTRQGDELACPNRECGYTAPLHDEES
ncbi:MAG: type I DNA topoisomerase [Desulfovibrionaceae bacterium]|nr:type I DNA topoisomerase [Desulfovibrionaceae bacterium]